MSKRLQWSPQTTMMMEEERRDKIFQIEKAIHEKEVQDATGKNKL